MSQVKWIKLSVDLFDNPKIKRIRRLPDGNNILLIWIYLLVIAGKCNSGGYIFITEHVPIEFEDISENIGIPIDTIKLALKIFIDFDMIEIEDNGLIYISDFEGHQDLSRLEKIKEQTRKRVKKYREKQKCNVTVTPCNATDKIRLDKNREDINISENVNENNSSLDLFGNKNNEQIKKNDIFTQQIKDIYDYFNKVNNKKIRYLCPDQKSLTTDANKVKSKLKLGYTSDDFKKAIDYKYLESKHNINSAKFNRMSTIAIQIQELIEFDINNKSDNSNWDKEFEEHCKKPINF